MGYKSKVCEHTDGPNIHIYYVGIPDSALTCCGCLPVPCNANEVDEPMTQKAQCDVPLCVWPACSLNLDFHRVE